MISHSELSAQALKARRLDAKRFWRLPQIQIDLETTSRSVLEKWFQQGTTDEIVSSCCSLYKMIVKSKLLTSKVGKRG